VSSRRPGRAPRVRVRVVRCQTVTVTRGSRSIAGTSRGAPRC
jgi:hypothetical protein